ncbi:MAG TPA: hypothetical protein VHT96_07490 [Clostridia bacterium]|nr:hypothetical protein [Clostridia bacterium]
MKAGFLSIKIMNWLNRMFQRQLFVYGAIVLAAGIAYCNSFFVPFILDDFGSISNNYSIHRLFDFPGLWKFYANRIVLYFTLSINYVIHGTDEGGYHAVNLFIHALNGILFYTVLKKLLALPYFKGKLVSRYSHVISVFAAILFVTHPIQINAVTYIIQRTASLAATFYLLAVVFFLEYRVKNKWYHLLLTVLFTVIAMFTKENTITIPFMLLLLEVMFFLRDEKTRWIKRILIFLLIFATVPIIPLTNLLLHGYSQSDPNVSFKASTSMDRFQYFYTELNVILLYIRLIFVPLGQVFDYSNDYPISVTIWDNQSYISLVILLLIASLSFYTWKRNRLVSLGILWFFLGLAVESSFISIKDVYFEHRVYFPLAGFIMFLVGMITYERKRKSLHILPIRKTILKNPVAWLLAVFLCLTPIYIGFTLYRNYIYGTTIRLWSDTVRKAPGSDRAHNSLATGYLNAYDEKKLNTEYLDLAEIEYKKAISMNNANSTAHTNLSKVYLLKEDYDSCITEANKALTYTKSEYAEFNLGSAYQKLGKTDDALKAFLKGYEFNKHSSFIVKAVADTYYELKDYRNAKRYYKEYLELNKRSKNTNINKRLKEIESKLSSGKK